MLIAEITEILNEHVPSLTAYDEVRINEQMGRDLAEYGYYDNGNLALRTCACGVMIDGFYEYHDHLLEIFRERA